MTDKFRKCIEGLVGARPILDMAVIDLTVAPEEAHDHQCDSRAIDVLDHLCCSRCGRYPKTE